MNLKKTHTHKKKYKKQKTKQKKRNNNERKDDDNYSNNNGLYIRVHTKRVGQYQNTDQQDDATSVHMCLYKYIVHTMYQSSVNAPALHT